jgi:hypothetical protein
MSKQSFRNPYARESVPDTEPLERPELDDLRTTAGTTLQPRCWRCIAPLAQCKCQGGPK